MLITKKGIFMKYILKILIFNFFITCHTTLPFVLANSLIRTDHELTTIENITTQHTLIGCNHSSLITVAVTHISRTTTNTVVMITTKKGYIYACPYQLFYDPVIAQWITANSITTSTTFLDSQLNHCACIDVETISVPPTDVYHISTTAPHNFFASQQELLTHNAFPVIVVGVTWLFGEGLKFAGLTLGAAAVGSYVGVNLYNKNKHAKAEFDIYLQGDTYGRYNPDPNDNNNDNNERKFNTTSKTEFFKARKNEYEQYRNNVYKRKRGSKGIENAEYLEWDNLHNDIEAYGRNRWHIGSIDPKTLKFYKPAVITRRLAK
jgi:hypothetical protein